MGDARGIALGRPDRHRHQDREDEQSARPAAHPTWPSPPTARNCGPSPPAPSTSLVPIDPTTDTAGTPITFAGSGITVESFGNGLALVVERLKPPTSPTPATSSRSTSRRAPSARRSRSRCSPRAWSSPTPPTRPARRPRRSPRTEPTQSGVVGDPTNPTMTINIGQLDENGEPVAAENLHVDRDQLQPGGAAGLEHHDHRHRQRTGRPLRPDRPRASPR